MSNLMCAASNCVFNKSGACYSGSIKVDGSKANTTMDTYCSTFSDKSISGFTSNSGESELVGTSQIHCEASHCKYNESKSCKANNVTINARSTSCQTFIER